MNKKLIALAVAGACVAPAAMAQTANPVTLYGKVYVTFESVEAGGSSTAANNDATKRRSRVEDQASRLGVRGTEDLGGGLKAIFQLETAFRPDQNNTVPTGGSAQPFATRNSGVGLQGVWGTIMMGRWDTPFKIATTDVDPYGDVTVGGIKTALNDGANFDRREQNVIQYWSPNWSGVAVRLSYQANEQKSPASDPKNYGGSVTYRGGPVYLFYTYEQHKDQVGDPFATAAAAGGKKETAHAVGGTFAWGPVRFGAIGERIKKSDRQDQKPYLFNIVYTMGNHVFSFQHEQNKGGRLNGQAQLDCSSNVGGWQYNFSKRTFLLAQYAQVKNDNTVSNCGTATFTAAPFTVTGGQDPKGFTLGISHVF